MKTVIATVIETNEYEIKLDVENDATEDEIKDVIEEAYMDDDHNMDIVNNTYDIKIKNSRGIDNEINRCGCGKSGIIKNGWRYTRLG